MLSFVWRSDLSRPRIEAVPPDLSRVCWAAKGRPWGSWRVRPGLVRGDAMIVAIVDRHPYRQVSWALLLDADERQGVDDDF